MFYRLPFVKFFSRILNRVTVTVILVALQLLWLCWVFFAITTGTGRVWVNGVLNALSLLILEAWLRTFIDRPDPAAAGPVDFSGV